MNTESQIQAIERKVTALISPDPESFLVEVRINPGNHIKVFIDADHGVSIDKLTQYNRSLYKFVEESGLFPADDFSLEISSPGLEEPLKLQRQYVKNVGRPVEVILKSGIKREGKLVAANEQEITIEEEKGHKKQRTIEQFSIPYQEIKTTKIQIKF